jgi:uncharacterized protein YjdB
MQTVQLFQAAKDVKGVNVIAVKLEDAGMEMLRQMGDTVKEKAPNMVAVLSSVTGEKVNLLCVAGPEAVKKGAHAGKVIKEVATLCGGGGGGRPDSATAGGKTATCVVTVEERYIPVSEVILNYTEVTLEVGESINIEATVLPENATEPTISWKSSSSKIATIRRKVISAVAPGTATITAKAGDIEAYCVVTVKSADSIDAATAEERYTIYDITGRLVRQDALSTDGLKQGIYIINGRKTVIE